MSRVQLALRVPDLDASIAFYTKLFGTEPAKLRDGYANFAIAEPPLKLVLFQGDASEDTRLDHLGVEVDTTSAVTDAAQRLADAGLTTTEEADTTCCYALQDKVSQITGWGWLYYAFPVSPRASPPTPAGRCPPPRPRSSVSPSAGSSTATAHAPS